MIRVLRFVAACALAGAVAACSTSDFKQPIADFSEATKGAAASFTTLADALDKAAFDQNVSDVVKGKAVDIPNCETADKCFLLVKLSDPTGKLTDRTIALKPSIVSNSRKLMAAILTYVASLNTIASNEDVAQIKTAADAIPAAVTGLADAVNGLNGAMNKSTDFKTTITAATTPAASILTIGLTKYAEYEKLKALRQATSMSEQVFPAAMTLFASLDWYQSRYVRQLLLEKKIEAGNEFRKIITKVRLLDQSEGERKKETDPKKEEEATQTYQTKRTALLSEKQHALEALQIAVEKYRISLAGQPGLAFDKLADAHAALATSLNSPHPDFKYVFAFVQQAADAAAQIAKDAQSIQDALKSKSKA